MTSLSVNLNKIALLRNQRDLDVPSVTRAARIAMDAGAQGITVHPRPDGRHIRSYDVEALAEIVTVEFNIEGNPFPKLMDVLRKLRPTQATLVPDSPEQGTSDHGWLLEAAGGPTRDAECLAPVLRELRQLGIRTSLFMDPDPVQIEAAARIGADRVELYTEDWARAFGGDRQDNVFAVYADAAACARDNELGINAGHDLNLENLPRFLEIPGVLEVSIGHALTADALELGLANAVRAYLDVLAAAS